jgi:hypothetical protein
LLFPNSWKTIESGMFCHDALSPSDAFNDAPTRTDEAAGTKTIDVSSLKKIPKHSSYFVVVNVQDVDLGRR